LVLNLGSGKDFRDDCINADIQLRVKHDWLLDICNVPWGDTISTRLGDFEVQPEMFDAILANDVLEHLPDLVGAMTSCKKLLKTGGEMRIHVPYDLSYGAWQDPTHVRAFNEKSWAYYCEWYWYLGWEDRFYVTSLEFRLNPIAQDLKLTQEELLRTPRAVDSMFVVLTKGKK